MTIKIVNALDNGKDGYTVTIDLDAANPEPLEDDERRTLTLSYGSYESSKNNGETKLQYVQRVKTEMQHTARFERRKRYKEQAPVIIAQLIGNDLT